MSKIPYDKDKFIDVDGKRYYAAKVGYLVLKCIKCKNIFLINEGYLDDAIYKFPDSSEDLENWSGLLELFCPFCGQKQKFVYDKIEVLYIKVNEK